MKEREKRVIKPYKREPRSTSTIPVFRGPRHIILKFIEKNSSMLKRMLLERDKEKRKKKKKFLQIKKQLTFQ